MVSFNHPASHFSIQGLSFLAKKIIGHRQLSDLGMQIADRVFINLAGRRIAARSKIPAAPSSKDIFH